MTQRLPDFSEMGAQAAARQEAERAAKEQADAVRAQATEKATQRAFKGIVSRPLRRMFLKDSLRRAEKAGAFDSTGGELEKEA